MAPRLNRTIHINAGYPEYDALFAYAESQGLKPNQAAAELILAGLASHATDAIFIAAARRSRYEVQKILIAESIKAVAHMWEQLRERAGELGIDMEGM